MSTQQAAFTQSLILESVDDVSMAVSSYATADRSRHKVAVEISENINNKWELPKLCTLHMTNL